MPMLSEDILVRPLTSADVPRIRELHVSNTEIIFHSFGKNA